MTFETTLKEKKELNGAIEHGKFLELDGKLYSPYKGRYARAYRPSEMHQELRELVLIESFASSEYDEWLDYTRSDYCHAVLAVGKPLSQIGRKKFEINVPVTKRVEAGNSILTIPSSPDTLHLISHCAIEIDLFIDNVLTTYVNDTDDNVWVMR